MDDGDDIALTANSKKMSHKNKLEAKQIKIKID